MYRYINEHRDEILEDATTQESVKGYASLRRKFPSADVTSESGECFRKEYKKYWRLNGVATSTTYREAYFRKMQELRDGRVNHAPSEILCGVIEALYDTERQHGLSGKFHFSFATKLLHTLNADLPIYDRNVREFYFLPEISHRWDFGTRKAEAIRSYQFLIDEYQRILRDNLLQCAIEEFRKKYPNEQDAFTNQKVIDLLIWRFVGLLKSGWLRDRVLKYG